MAFLSVPVVIYTLKTLRKEKILCTCFMNAEDNARITNCEEPALLSGTSTGNIYIWDLKTLRIKYELQGHNKVGVMAVFMVKDYIISHGRDCHVNSWNFNGEKWIINRTFPAAEVGFCPTAFVIQPSAIKLLIPSENNNLDVVDYESGNVLSKINVESHGMCISVKVKTHKDVTYVFCGHEDGYITAWNFDTMTEIDALQIKVLSVFCIDVDLEHRSRGVSGMPEGPLLIWNVDKDMKLSFHKSVQLKNNGVSDVRIRPDGKILVVGCWDGSVRVFGWKTFKLIAVMYQDSEISCVSFSNGTDAVRKHKSVFSAGTREGNIALYSIS